MTYFLPTSICICQQILPARLHKHAKLHAFSFRSFASQEASLVQEVVYTVQGLAAKEGEPKVRI